MAQVVRNGIVTSVTMPWEHPSHATLHVVDGVLTEAECTTLIALSEEAGYETALINIGRGQQALMSDVRNNDRAMIDDASLAELIWRRILERCDAEMLRVHDMGGVAGPMKLRHFAVGLNERLRFLRYDPGMYFLPHSDGCFLRDSGPRGGERSFVTMQLYLNEGFEGGATRFLDPMDNSNFYDVVPKTGSVLVFQHPMYHEGALLCEGRKYAIRTDVMFTAMGPGHDYAFEPMPDAPSPIFAKFLDATQGATPAPEAEDTPTTAEDATTAAAAEADAPAPAPDAEVPEVEAPAEASPASPPVAP